MDPARVQRWRDFYEQHRQISYRYLYYTMTLGAPPHYKLDAIFQAHRQAPYVRNYQELHTYVEENLVRALDHRMRVRLNPADAAQEESTLRDEVANGLVLEDDFYAGLAEFEQNPDKTAPGFFAELLAAVRG